MAGNAGQVGLMGRAAVGPRGQAGAGRYRDGVRSDAARTEAGGGRRFAALWPTGPSLPGLWPPGPERIWARGPQGPNGCEPGGHRARTGVGRGATGAERVWAGGP